MESSLSILPNFQIKSPRNKLCLCDKKNSRTAEYKGKGANIFKSAIRKQLIDEGYRIRGNVGDQWSDLQGDYLADRNFKIPNPMYYVPWNSVFIFFPVRRGLKLKSVEMNKNLRSYLWFSRWIISSWDLFARFKERSCLIYLNETLTKPIIYTVSI